MRRRAPGLGVGTRACWPSSALVLWRRLGWLLFFARGRLVFFMGRVDGTRLTEHAGAVSLSRLRGHWPHDFSLRSLGSWSLIMAIRLMAVLWSRWGFVLIVTGYFAPVSTFTRLQSHMMIDDNSVFTCCSLWRQLENPSSVILAGDRSIYGM